MDVMELAMVAGWAAAIVFYWAYSDEVKRSRRLEEFYMDFHEVKMPIAMAKLKPIAIKEEG